MVYLQCLRYYVCVLQYRLLEDCLPLIEQLQRAATLPAAEQQAMVSAIVTHKQHLLRFIPTWWVGMATGIKKTPHGG